MIASRRRVATWLTLLTTVTAMAAVTATWVSAHGGDGALIHACVNNASGGIKIVGPNGTCSGNEHELDWNIQGVQGIQGEQGEQGIQGEPGIQGTQGIQGVPGTNGTNGVNGANGTNGVSGWEMKSDTTTTPNAMTAATAVCSPGKKVVGGGYTILEGDKIYGSMPNADGTSWHTVALVTGPSAGPRTVWAICVIAQ